MTPSRDTRFPSITPWTTIAALAIAFVVLAILARVVGTLPGDLAISEFVQRAHGQIPRGIWHVGNTFGTTMYAVGVFVLVLIAMLIVRWWREAIFLALVMVGRILAMPLKELLHSPRPTSAQLTIVEIEEGFGFPSGHTLTATILFGGLVVIAIRRAPQVDRRLLLAIWVLGVLATIFARVWSGAHWSSDTLGSVLLGLSIVLTAANLSALIVRRTSTSVQAASHPQT